MIKSYIKLAWRNLLADRTFSFINIFGLGIGLAAAILLFIYISYETSYDKANLSNSSVYRLLLDLKDDSGGETWAVLPSAIASSAELNIPEIEMATRVWKNNYGLNTYVNTGDKKLIEKKFFWVDDQFFEIFNLEVVLGSRNFSSPNEILVSESTAEVYFGRENPLGRVIRINEEHNLEITGVYKDFPDNSSLDMNILGSMRLLPFYDNRTWSNARFETFVSMSGNTNTEEVKKKLQNLLDREVLPSKQWYVLNLQPIGDIHLYSTHIKNSMLSNFGSYKEVKNLTILAVVLLLIACLNYMNLSTARSQKRSKDVGINKTLGASGKSLILRFYMETGVVVSIAIFMGICLTLLTLPLLNLLIENEISYSYLLEPQFVGKLVFIWLVITLISGLYPALHLAKLSPKNLLVRGDSRSWASGFVRKGLVVLQFLAASILITGVLIMQDQLEFIQNRDLGYSADGVIAISVKGVENNSEINPLIDDLKTLSNVESVSLVQGFPSTEVSTRALKRIGANGEGVKIQANKADDQITEALELKFLAGSKLPEFKSDGDSIVDIILNKTAITYLGYSPEEAIGKKVEMQLGGSSYIHGVVDDFNFASLHTPIGAYAFHNGENDRQYYLLVRFETSSLKDNIASFQNLYSKFLPNLVFEYTFLDTNLESLYRSERRTSIVSSIFSLLAILIASIGLFGLAAFVAEKRKKEFGIRKVLGASIFGLVNLITVDFIKLVSISLIIGIPVAYWIMERWLDNFAYRIDINFSVFLITAILALGIAIVTVALKAIQTAWQNPVESIRN